MSAKTRGDTGWPPSHYTPIPRFDLSMVERRAGAESSHFLLMLVEEAGRRRSRRGKHPAEVLLVDPVGPLDLDSASAWPA
jgi:hypothetical protein